MQEHITSFTEGHIALRHEAFKDASISKKLKTLLKFYPGVKQVNMDENAGTLEINYDAARLSKDKVMGLLKQGEAWLAGSQK